VNAPVSLDPDVLDVLAVVGTATGVLGLIAALLAHLRIRRLRTTFAVFRGPDGNATDVIEAVHRQVLEVRELRSDVVGVHRHLDELTADTADALRHVAVVRYDAFSEMGGRLSFSAALLDDAGDGLVLTSINGRSESRTYAKGVKAGASEASLSPEEEQAISYARRSAAGPRRGAGA
jgi:hypothetical protein